MSFLARLTFTKDESGELEENYHNVLECSFEFNVATDPKGKRTSDLRGGQIHLRIETDHKADWLQWLHNPDENRHGEIIFYKTDMMAVGKKVDHWFSFSCRW